MHVRQARRHLPLPDYDLPDAGAVTLTMYGALIDPADSQLLIQEMELPLADVLALAHMKTRVQILPQTLEPPRIGAPDGHRQGRCPRYDSRVGWPGGRGGGNRPDGSMPTRCRRLTRLCEPDRPSGHRHVLLPAARQKLQERPGGGRCPCAWRLQRLPGGSPALLRARCETRGSGRVAGAEGRIARTPLACSAWAEGANAANGLRPAL
jgi:hypothetical protein